MITRVMNWDLAVIAFAQEVRGQPHVWGSTDCASIVRRACSLSIGREAFPTLGNWTTRTGALRVFRRTDVLATLAEAGFVEVGRRYATCGDVALGPLEDADGLPQFSLILRRSKVLASTPAHGVQVVGMDWLDPGTRFFRNV